MYNVLEGWCRMLDIFSKILSIILYLIKLDFTGFLSVLKQKEYYFKEYTKHVTIYKNGNGIIINSFKIKIVNAKKMGCIYRKLNIKDGYKEASFPKLNEMKSTKIDDRFKKFGYWAKSSNDILTKSKEYYWDDNDYNKVDPDAKADDKELRWKLILNDGKIKNRGEYEITYVISIPGMFPIENGFYYNDLHNPKYIDNYDFSSSIKVEHEIKKLNYIVSFEHGINIDETPLCYMYSHNNNNHSNKKKIHGKEIDNYIFRKFEYNIKRPKYQRNIKINWNITEKQRNT